MEVCAMEVCVCVFVDVDIKVGIRGYVDGNNEKKENATVRVGVVFVVEKNGEVASMFG